MKVSETALLVIFLALGDFCGGHLAQAERIDGGGLTKDVPPGEIYEACMMLSSGDQVAYAFTASNSLNFNIHYHDGAEIIYPGPERNLAEENASFTAESEQHYCLMWENKGNEPVVLQMDYQLLRHLD